MKNITLITLALLSILTSACATQQPRGYELPPALSEVFRGGQLKGLASTEAPVLGPTDRVGRVGMVCTQEPIYDSWGYYVRTDVQCF